MVRKLLCLCLAAFFLAGCGPVKTELDNEQGRLDAAAPVLTGATTVGQRFVSHHAGLNAVEVLLVVYGETGASDGKIVFHLRSNPTDETDLVTRVRSTATLKHNQPLRFTFPPLWDSDNRTYFFTLEGVGNTRVTVWYNTVDAYGEGTMFVNGTPQAGDLQFKTYYAYDLGQMLRDLWQGMIRHSRLVPPILALVLLPGAVVWLWLWPFEDAVPHPAEQIALSIGLSLAVWPLVLLYTSALGLRVTGPRLAGGLALAALTGLGRLWQLRWRPLQTWRSRRTGLQLALFAALTGITLAVRFLQVRGLVVPAWVDGLHHTLMTQLMVRAGGVPLDYRPYLDIGPFIYHYGFHALAAGLTWLSGLAEPQAVLAMGQVVNVLVGVGLYLLATRLSRRATAGLIALGVVGTISFMPAYYVSWGRYTQLAGLAVLPTAVVLTMEWLEQGDRRRLLLAALAVAGLGVVHYRVLSFYVAFVIALLAYETARALLSRRGAMALVQLWGRTAVLAGLALLLLAPWLVRLYGALVPSGRLWGWLHARASFNVVPRGLIDIGYDRPLLRLALLSGVLGLIWWRRTTLLVLLWCAVAILFANPNVLGLRETWLLSNSVLVISLFFPVALMVGVLGARIVEAIGEHGAGRRYRLVQLLLGAAFCAAVLRGAWDMVDIVNPVTVIATREDMAAMAWIRAHTPPDARFLTNVRIWQGHTYMGADAGYWIPLLTGRQTLVPPILYTYGSRAAFYRVQRVLEALAAIRGPEDPAFWSFVTQHGIDYVYLGARASPWKPKQFVNRPEFETVYSNGAAWIFRIRK